jgi:glycosyltransferase involved in cell wall biosynthesis
LVIGSKQLHWLIVEDALRDRKGHWFEYISTFSQGLRALGDQVTILADRRAETFILENLQAKPVLPDSIWHRMGDEAGVLSRYLRVPTHAWQTWRAVRRFLRNENRWDIIFVPTVLVHHLLGWYVLIRHTLRKSSVRVLLFFPNLPIRLDSEGNPRWHSSPTTHLMRFLLGELNSDILSGRLILGVETREMKDAFEQLIDLPVVYLPHPVMPLPDAAESPVPSQIMMACYGSARPEKGSDVLQEALLSYLHQFPNEAIRFAIQWMQDFKNDRGEWIELSPDLQAHPRMNVIRRYFDNGEYDRHLRKTQVMLLPYRRSSYSLRVSRVIIEAMVNGIPVVATIGTTLSLQAAEYGALTGCDDGSAESLAAAIETVRRNYPELRSRALKQMLEAREHFSVRNFREMVFSKGSSVNAK